MSETQKITPLAAVDNPYNIKLNNDIVVSADEMTAKTNVTIESALTVNAGEYNTTFTDDSGRISIFNSDTFNYNIELSLSPSVSYTGTPKLKDVNNNTYITSGQIFSPGTIIAKVDLSDIKVDNSKYNLVEKTPVQIQIIISPAPITPTTPQ